MSVHPRHPGGCARLLLLGPPSGPGATDEVSRMAPVRQPLSSMMLTVLGLVWLYPAVGLAQPASVDRTLRYYQHLVQRQPLNAKTYYLLGDAYIQKARESADATYFTLAEQALRKALEITPQYSQALRHLA